MILVIFLDLRRGRARDRFYRGILKNLTNGKIQIMATAHILTELEHFTKGSVKFLVSG